MPNVTFYLQPDGQVVAQKGDAFFSFPPQTNASARMDHLLRHRTAVNFDSAPFTQTGVDVSNATVLEVVELELDTGAERIELSHAQADEQRIYVSGSSTTFANVEPIGLTVADVQATYKTLIQEAKKHGVTVKYKYKTASRLKALLATATPELELYQQRYDALVAKWQEKLSVGIYVGCRDDANLNALYSMHHDMVPMTYRSTPIGQLIEINVSLNERLRSIKQYSEIAV